MKSIKIEPVKKFSKRSKKTWIGDDGNLISDNRV